jgi:hypothetical protein
MCAPGQSPQMAPVPSAARPAGADGLAGARDLASAEDLAGAGGLAGAAGSVGAVGAAGAVAPAGVRDMAGAEDLAGPAAMAASRGSVPLSATEAAAMVEAGLAYLARVDATAAPTVVQADWLRLLERGESMLTVARSCVLSAFNASLGFQDDGYRSARSWLKWQTRVTGPAAAGAVGWMRRLEAHRAVRDALGDGAVSASWARQICDWSDLLPWAARGDADVILLAAAAGGAELADLAALAEEMLSRTARPDEDGADDGFGDRSVRLETHLRGAGKLDGDLTPQCAAAMQAVLDCLGKKAGPEDIRTQRQRDHDALEEAFRRLIGSGCLPDRAGQPTQIQLNMNLSQLIGPGSPGPGSPSPGSPGSGDPGDGDPGDGGPGDGGPGDGGAGHGGAGHGGAGQPVLSGPVPWPQAGPGDDCDATIVPVLTGHVDPVVLDRLAALLLRRGACRCQHNDKADAEDADDLGARCMARARELVLREAIALLSGPAGLAAWLRTSQLTGPAATISLPLDTGTPTDTIPPHLRRAVIRRDRHCAWPGGCSQPPAACQVHHVISRSQGGPTTLVNLGLFCTFHHLIVIHRWGWSLALHADGTYTATNPDRTRTLHSHSPPVAAA